MDDHLVDVVMAVWQKIIAVRVVVTTRDSDREVKDVEDNEGDDNQTADHHDSG